MGRLQHQFRSSAFHIVGERLRCALACMVCVRDPHLCKLDMAKRIKHAKRTVSWEMCSFQSAQNQFRKGPDSGGVSTASVGFCSKAYVNPISGHPVSLTQGFVVATRNVMNWAVQTKSARSSPWATQGQGSGFPAIMENRIGQRVILNSTEMNHNVLMRASFLFLVSSQTIFYILRLAKYGTEPEHTVDKQNPAPRKNP